MHVVLGLWNHITLHHQLVPVSSCQLVAVLAQACNVHHSLQLYISLLLTGVGGSKLCDVRHLWRLLSVLSAVWEPTVCLNGLPGPVLCVCDFIVAS